MKPGFIPEMDIRKVSSGPPAYLKPNQNIEHHAIPESYGGRNMSENLKPNSYFYKPLKSAPAFVNTQSASQKESMPLEDGSNTAKRALGGIDTRHPEKSAESARWSSHLGRYHGDDLSQLSRFEDGLSLLQLSGCKEGLSHGPMCRCAQTTDPVNKFQDFTATNWPVAEKNLSFTYCNEDCRNIREDWNRVVPFPPVQFESSGVPFSDDVSVLHKTGFENDRMHQSHDASLSVILMKLQTQSKVIEKLHNGLKRLEDERDAYTQLFRELRDEMIALHGQLAESQTSAGLHRDLGVWKHQIATEMRQLKADLNRFHNQDKDVAAENSNRMAELRHESSETKKFFSDEVQTVRREIRKLHSRIGQLEVDMVGVLSENKGLCRRLQKLEKTVDSVVQSQAFLGRDMCKMQNQQSKDRTDLEQIQRRCGYISQKLNLQTNVGNYGILKDVPTTSLRTADLQQKTGRKSRLSRTKAKHRAQEDLSLDVTSESSSVTSLVDTASINNCTLAESSRGRELGVNFTPKKTKGKKKTKRISKKDGSSEMFSQLPDMDTPDSLAETEGRLTNLEMDKGEEVERDSGAAQKLLSANVGQSASYFTSTTTTTTTSSSSSSSSSTSSCSTSSTDLSTSSRCSDNRADKN